MKDFFPTLDMKPNPNCDNKWCVKRQADYQVSRHPIASRRARAHAPLRCRRRHFRLLMRTRSQARAANTHRVHVRAA